jgi:hypothetical protein
MGDATHSYAAPPLFKAVEVEVEVALVDVRETMVEHGIYFTCVVVPHAGGGHVVGHL